MMIHEIVQVATECGTEPVCLYPIFCCTHGTCKLYLLMIFASGRLVCHGKAYSDEEFAKVVTEGCMRTSLRDGERVLIPNLITFKVTSVLPVINESEFLKEVADIRRELNGQPTTLDACREAYARFQREPSEKNRFALKDAYAAIPRHMDVWLLPFPRTPAEIEDAIAGIRPPTGQSG